MLSQIECADGYDDLTVLSRTQEIHHSNETYGVEAPHLRFARQATTKKVTTKKETTKKATTKKAVTTKGTTKKATTKKGATTPKVPVVESWMDPIPELIIVGNHEKATTKKGATIPPGWVGRSGPIARMLPIPDAVTESSDYYGDEEEYPENDETMNPGNRFVVSTDQVTQKTPTYRYYYEYYSPPRQTRYFNSFSFKRRFRNKWNWWGKAYPHSWLWAPTS